MGHLRSMTCLTALTIAALPASARAETYEVKCYFVGIYGDADHDGYAAIGSYPVTLQVAREDRLSCPDGFVRRAGDCDDTKAWIHPRRGEIAFNGVDDNCDGQTDETEPIYYEQGYGNTTSGFVIRAKVNDATIVQHAADLYVRVFLNPLDSSTVLAAQPLVKVTGLSYANPYVEVAVANQAPNRVFGAFLRFYRPLSFTPPVGIASKTAGAVSTAATASSSGSYLTSGSLPVRYVQVGEDSLWYTTTTDGTSGMSKLRTDVLLRALKQVEESRLGRVGYWGSVDDEGTRYGADIGDLWCSEFYSWSVKPYVPVSGNTVAALKSKFKLKGAYYTDVQGVAARGDWIHTSTHSTMFLALDTAVLPREIWTVEGNLDNEVRVMHRKVSDYVGVGHIQSSLWSWP